MSDLGLLFILPTLPRFTGREVRQALQQGFHSRLLIPLQDAALARQPLVLSQAQGLQLRAQRGQAAQQLGQVCTLREVQVAHVWHCL